MDFLGCVYSKIFKVYRKIEKYLRINIIPLRVFVCLFLIHLEKKKEFVKSA